MNLTNTCNEQTANHLMTTKYSKKQEQQEQ